MFKNFMNFRALLVACFVLLPFATFAQVTVSGTVRESSGEPIIGASVLEKGTSNGAATDLNGHFSFKASSDKAQLVVSYVGFQNQTVSLAGRKNLVITMKTDDELLEDVVVVGYGTMKKKLVTGSTIEVKGEDIAKLNTTSALGALQSQAPGVNIQSKSGQPGEGFNINIRGAGTNGSTTPLYVIDGVAGGDINSIAPGDIERIDVLKDAASAAIYGARAANGVILITTKQGKAGAIQVSYDGYVGWQNAYKMPQLLNAKQYMEVMDQINVNSGGSPFDWKTIVGEEKYNAYMDGSDEGTNWLEAIRNKNAITTSHSLNITGGSDRSTFSSGLSYMKQDGIFGGPAASNYARFTGRLNSEHVLWRGKTHDIITVGENLYYNHNEKSGISIGSQYANPISDALRAEPIIPIYNSDGNYFAGSDYGSETSGLKAYPSAGMYFSNLLYDLSNNQDANNKSKNYSLNMNAYFKIQPIKGLTWKSLFGYKHSSSSWRGYNAAYDDNANVNKTRNVNNVNQNMSTGWSWSMEHTLNYTFDIAKNHFDVLLGGSLERSGYGMGEYMEGSSSDLIFSDFDRAYLTNAQASTGVTVGGYPWGDSTLASYFGRINYDYNETYMLSLILRRDGSSNFARGHRWGWFPSASVGWVLSNEKFMESTKSWLDFLKIRGSYGQNGNCNISNFQYLATVTFDEQGQYPFNTKNSYTQGGYTAALTNEDLTWETSEQYNVGLDARFLNNRLTFGFDWYTKNTKDLLIDAPVLLEYGLDAPVINGGDIRNRGIEFSLGWRDRVGDFGYSINANAAHNSNEVTRVANQNGYINGSESALQTQGTYVYRMEVGHPIGYFYGYKTAGVIQNDADLATYLSENCGGKAENSKQGESIQPGDLKFVDTNKDGKITDEDKCEIGNPHPDWTAGLTLSFDYAGFDLGATFYGSFGNQVYKYWRNEGSAWYENYTTNVYNYWHGEGTSNTYPRLEKSNQSVNWTENSDVFCQNADYVRLQNLTVGYDFAKKIWKNGPFSQLRVYFTAQNLVTFTGYDGMDPENGNNAGAADAWARGLDLGFYPAARTYMVGVNLKVADKKAQPAKEPYQTQFIEKEVVKEVPVVKEVVKEVKSNELVQDTYVVTFPVNSSEIKNNAELDGIPSGSTVEIVAYASPEGNADANVALSQRRADAVANYLKSKGITVKRISAKGADTEHANRIAIVTVK